MQMNILQQEDLIKGMPDEPLMQEAKFPTGQVPQYLVISEIQRRKDMRDRFSSEQEQPQGTVSEQFVAESTAPQGIGALQPQMPPQMPPGAAMAPVQPPMPTAPMQVPPAEIAPPMASTPLMPETMAAGGGMMPYRRMAGGGIIPPNALVEDASKFSQDSLYDVDPSQMAMMNTVDMGIPSVLPMSGGGVGRMQEGGVSPGDFVSMSRNFPPIPFRSLAREQMDAMSQEDVGAYNTNVLDLLEAKERGRSQDQVSNSSGANIDPRDALAAQLAGMPHREYAEAGDTSSQRLEDVLSSIELDPRDRMPVGEVGPPIPAEEAKPPTSENEQRAAELSDLVEMLNNEQLNNEQLLEAPSINVEGLIKELEGYKGRDISQVDYSDLIKANQEKSSKDATSRAYINLGVGIARGDIASGFEKAGQAVADVQDRQFELNQALELAQRGALTEAEASKLARDIGITEKQLDVLQDIESTRAQLAASSGTSATRLRTQKILELMSSQNLPWEEAVSIVDGYQGARQNPETGKIEVTTLRDGQWVAYELAVDAPKAPPEMVENIVGPEPGQTLFDLAEFATGPVSGLKSLWAYPAAWAGKSYAEKELAARQIFLNASQDLIRSLAINDRYAVAEQNRIIDFVSMTPNILMSPPLLKNKMIGVKTALEVKLNQDLLDADDTGLPNDQRNAAKQSAVAVRNFLSIMGEPILAEDLTAESTADPEAGSPPQKYLDQGGDTALWSRIPKEKRDKLWPTN